MKLYFLLTLLFFSFTARSAELMVSGGVDFNQTNLFGQNQSPTYRGSGQWGELEYLLPFGGGNAISLFGHYHQSEQDNTFKESLIKEKLTLSYYGAGMKYWMNRTFLSFSYGKLRFKDDVTGDVERVIKENANSFELGVGYRVRLARAVGLIFSLNANYASLRLPDSSNVPYKYNFWNYRAAVGLNFVIPSSLGPASSGPSTSTSN
jgi:hypothetical protein